MTPVEESGRDALAAFRRACEHPEPDAGPAGLVDLVEAGCAARELAPVPLDGAEPAAADPVQVRVVRDRLGKLGYAVVEPTGTDRGAWTPGLTAALREFQREAGLPDHGRIELQTWNRLRELFDFETELRTDWCFVDGRPRPALVRAERLRLAVLGFPVRKDGVERARTLWARTMADLGLADARLGAALTPESAALLFAHDALVERLGAVDQASLAALPATRRKALAGLMVCAAKIELWLQGYDVKPDGVPTLQRQRLAGRPGLRRVVRESEPANALRRFFKDTELAGMMRFAPVERLQGGLPEFFRRVRELGREEGAASAERDSALVVQAIEERLAVEKGAAPDLSLWAKMRAAGAAMANALFDGVRRVVAWIGRLLRGAAKALARLLEESWLGNLFRAARYFAGAVALRIRKAARVFASGVSFLFSAHQASEPAGHAVAMRGGDFDLRCVIDAGADAAVVGAWAEGLAARACHLGLATRMLALVFGALRRGLAGAAGGPVGWLALVLGLARLYSQARALGRELDAVPLD